MPIGGVGLATLASLALAAPASAQDRADPDQQDDGVEEAVADYIDGANPPPPGGEREIGFEADTLEYDSDQDIIFARGNVLLRDGDRSVRADEVRWNRPAGRIDASGNVRYVDGDGNQLYASQLELSDKFETGALSDLLLVLREGGRLAAESGERTDDGRIALVRGAYSGCAVTTPEGCPKRPSWKITAERVVYDPDANRVRFEGGYFSLFGQRILPLPTLELRTDGGPSSGVLVPSLSISRSNGVELSGSYYRRLAENRDLKLGAHIFTEAAPMASSLVKDGTGENF